MRKGKTKTPPLPRPDVIARIYAEHHRDEALRRHKLLAAQGRRKDAKAALREANRQDRLVKQLRAREERVEAESERDRLAQRGIELVEAGHLPEARAVAAQAEKWNRRVKRLVNLEGARRGERGTERKKKVGKRAVRARRPAG